MAASDRVYGFWNTLQCTSAAGPGEAKLEKSRERERESRCQLKEEEDEYNEKKAALHIKESW